MKKFRQWIADTFGHTASRSTIWKVLHRADLSWKKVKKLLGKACPAKREQFLKDFHALYELVRSEQVLLIYVDESHFHRDLQTGYTWSAKGKRAWRVSGCPKLSERINWFGAYDFSRGQCLIWHEGACNGASTQAFLRRIKEWVAETKQRVVIIWDGAPWHRSRAVQAEAAQLGLEIRFLPGYSPDMNPIEGLWKWMREEVLHGYCHKSLAELAQTCQAFIERINRDPLGIINRLWPKFELDPEVEKLRIPK